MNVCGNDEKPEYNGEKCSCAGCPLGKCTILCSCSGPVAFNKTSGCSFEPVPDLEGVDPE
jgi:hypothetical protein